MKTRILLALVVSIFAVAFARLPVPNASFIIENPNLTDDERKIVYIDYMQKLNGMTKEELNGKNLDDIVELIIATLTDRKEEQYKRASAIRKHLKYFIEHRTNAVPRADFMRAERKPSMSRPLRERPSKPLKPILPNESNPSYESNPSNKSNPSNETNLSELPPEDVKSYLIRYVHSLDGTIETALTYSVKGVPELIELALVGLKKRLSAEKDPKQIDLIEQHINYFQNAKLTYGH